MKIDSEFINEKTLKLLNPYQREIVSMWFGLNGGVTFGLPSIARQKNRSKATVQRDLDQAIRLMVNGASREPPPHQKRAGELPSRRRGVSCLSVPVVLRATGRVFCDIMLYGVTSDDLEPALQTALARRGFDAKRYGVNLKDARAILVGGGEQYLT